MWVAPSPLFSRRRGPNIKNFGWGLKWGVSGAFLFVYVLFALLSNLRTFVCNCKLCTFMAFLGTLFKENFRHKMTTIVGNRGQWWTSTLSPHLLSPHLDFPSWLENCNPGLKSSILIDNFNPGVSIWAALQVYRKGLDRQCHPRSNLVSQTLHHLSRATAVTLHSCRIFRLMFSQCRTRIALHPLKSLKKSPVAPFWGGVAP